MKRLLITGDSHLASKYTYSTNANPLKDIFFKKSFNAIKQIADFSYKNNCDILNAGDFFDDSLVDAPEFYAATTLLSYIQKKKINMFMTAGNHEIGYESGIPVVMQSLSNMYENIHVNDYKKEWTVRKWEGLNIYMMRYYREGVFNKHFESLLNTEIKQPACLCIHQNIKGVQMGNTLGRHGLTEEELCDKAKNKFKFIVCGHIHHPFYGDRYGMPLLIPGSSTAVDFKDEGKRKRFYALDFNEDYSIKKCHKIPFKDQIIFKTLDKSELKDIKDFNNLFLRIRLPVGDSLEEIKKITSGSVGVQPQWIRQDYSSDFVGYERKIGMDIDDWLSKYMDIKGFDKEEIAELISFKEKEFGKN